MTLLDTLPVEVLELLFLYVRVEDLPAVWQVVGMEGSESFWRKVCRREGYSKIPGEEEGWSYVVRRNINWITRRYEKREYNFYTFQSKYLEAEDTLHGRNLLMKNPITSELLIWNLENDPKLVEKLACYCFRAGGAKVYLKLGSDSKVYSKEKRQYHTLIDLSHTKNLGNPKAIVLSNDFLASFRDGYEDILVIDFTKLVQFGVNVSQKVIQCSLSLQNDVLNILVTERNHYALKRFCLRTKEWLQDVCLFNGASLISIPNLRYSQDLIVAWCKIYDTAYITPLNIWNNRGELVKTLSIDFIKSFGPTSQSRDHENILWLIVEGEYVIVSISPTSLTIWNSGDPEICRELQKDNDHSKNPCTVSSSLLVLSYSHCFKLIDFKKAVYLYEVPFEVENKNLPFQWYANEYFYITFSEVKEECNVDTSQRPTTSHPLQCLKPPDVSTKIDCIMTIYDFTGHTLSY